MLRRFALAFVLAAPAAVAQAGPHAVDVSAEGKAHADVRAFPGGPMGEAAGFLLRRARVEVTAEVGGWLRAVVEPDFGEGAVQLKDGYVEADLGPLAVRLGQFKTPVGYESLRSSSDLRFAERAFPTALSPRRDVGVMLTSDSARIEAQRGLFNGVPDGASGSDNWGSGPDAAARVFARPSGLLDGLGVGIAVAARAEWGTPDASGLDVLSRRLSSGDGLQVGFSSDERDDALEVLPRVFGFVAVPLVLLALLGGWFMASRALCPVRHLVGTLEAISATDGIDRRATVPEARGELADLLRLFNRTLDRVEALVGQLGATLDDVAHDLRTPLTAIRGTAELALARDREPEAYRAALARIAEATETAQDTLDTVMEVAEAEAGLDLALAPLALDAVARSPTSSTTPSSTRRRAGA